RTPRAAAYPPLTPPPVLATSAARSDGTPRTRYSRRIEPGVVPPLVHVSLVLLVGVDPDLGGVVRSHRPPLEILEEMLGGSLGVVLPRRHPREHRDPLIGGSLQERLPVVELLRQRLHRREPRAPLGLLLGLGRVGQTEIDVGGHAGGARAGGMGVRRDDQLRQLIEQGEL